MSEHCHITQHRTASIGRGVTAAAHVYVAEGSIVEAGSHLVENVPPYVVVSGSPARIVGYLNPPIPNFLESSNKELIRASDLPDTRVLLGCKLVELGTYKDMRGSLVFGCTTQTLPFAPARFFITSCRDREDVRGDHAHRTLQEVLVPVNGSLKVGISDGHSSVTILLDSEAIGLHIPVLTWTTQFDFEPQSSLLVLASEPYDEASYVRSYSDFLRLVSGSPAKCLRREEPK